MLTVSKNIRYIGVDDDNLDLFEGQYPLTSGVLYNSYLIDDEKIAVMDTVDARRTDEWLALLEDELRGRRPDYLVVHHVEPDHSGSIGAALERYPDMKVVISAKGASMLGNFIDGIDASERCVVIKDGDTLPLGRGELKFYAAPMVHWPEVMLSLYTPDGVLFTADAFGSFGAPSSPGAWDEEGRRYYCNIVGKYGLSVRNLMKKLKEETFSVIAPLHGPVLKDNLEHYWNLYDKWSAYQPEEPKGVLVAYASIYGSTARAARRIASMLGEDERCGEVVLMDLSRHDVSYAVAEAFRMGRLVLCSVTMDGEIFPAMHDFLHHLRLKNLQRRRVGLVENGSWAPAAGKKMAAMLAEMKEMEVVAPVVTLHGHLRDNDSAPMKELVESMVKE